MRLKKTMMLWPRKEEGIPEFYIVFDIRRTWCDLYRVWLRLDCWNCVYALKTTLRTYLRSNLVDTYV